MSHSPQYRKESDMTEQLHLVFTDCCCYLEMLILELKMGGKKYNVLSLHYMSGSVLQPFYLPYKSHRPLDQFLSMCSYFYSHLAVAKTEFHEFENIFHGLKISKWLIQEV